MKNYLACREIGSDGPQLRGKKSTETDPKMTEMRELSDKDIKTAIINKTYMLRRQGKV